mmetsp:Transcript_8693/g.22498  ORF Transcript_8693/g.22498 Transcript_8693/m.22498 type:complete len:228 (+) Transcript_8693:357-1040(+)
MLRVSNVVRHILCDEADMLVTRALELVLHSLKPVKQLESICSGQRGNVGLSSTRRRRLEALSVHLARHLDRAVGAEARNWHTCCRNYRRALLRVELEEVALCLRELLCSCAPGREAKACRRAAHRDLGFARRLVAVEVDDRSRLARPHPDAAVLVHRYFHKTWVSTHLGAAKIRVVRSRLRLSRRLGRGICDRGCRSRCGHCLGGRSCRHGLLLFRRLGSHSGRRRG